MYKFLIFNDYLKNCIDKFSQKRYSKDEFKIFFIHSER